jgi:hypothetical protein
MYQTHTKKQKLSKGFSLTFKATDIRKAAANAETLDAIRNGSAARAKVIPTKREKDADARRQRKNWRKDIRSEYGY